MAIWRVSLDEDGRQFDEQVFLDDTSSDGRHILFGPFGTADVGAPGGQGLVSYEFDTVTGERRPILVDLVAPVTSFGRDFLVVDADASVVAFDEFTESLVPGDTNGEKDVFVLDRASGEVVRASEAEDGAEANGLSTRPLLTADGTQVFFSSEATNLVPGDANGLTDVFARDLGTDALANLTPTRDGDTAGFDFEPRAASADGSQLLLVGGTPDGTGEGTFLLDRDADGLTRLSERGDPLSTVGNLPDLSGDGTLALLPGDDGSLVLRNLTTGDVATVVEDEFFGGADLSDDGRFVAFATEQDGLVPGDAGGDSDIFVFDSATGETWRVSLDENGEPFAGRGSGSFFLGEVETSPAGGFPIVAFGSDLPLVDRDTNGTTDVYAIEVDAIAVADRAVTAPGTPVRVDVLANDIDLDGAAPSIAAVGPAADGTAVAEDGAIVFTPAAGFADSTSFTYTIDDGEGNLDQAVVRVQVVEEGPLVVTTVEDVVAADGELSLREAVEAANTRAGADTIAFADVLLGATLVLEQGTLGVADDLVIDGDAADGGAGGVTLAVAAPAGSGGFLAAGVRASGASLRLEDLTLAAQEPFGSVGEGLVGTDADIELVRGAVNGFGRASATGVRVDGGSLLVEASKISGLGAYYDAVGIAASGASVRVVGSRISDIGSEFGAGISAYGSLELVDTVVRDIRGDYAYAVVGSGDALVAGTTIADVYSSAGAAAGLTVGGALTLANSTISGIYSDEGGGGVLVRGTGRGTVTNTTIAGNQGSSAGFAGLVVDDGASLRLENSLVAGNLSGREFEGFEISDVVGGISSNGRNVFGQAAVPGATAGDVTGADVRGLFAVLDAEGQPVLADNGGPTPTVALLEAPGNPAVDAADPAVAPELDQRGFPRVGAPDIGSFEAGDGGGGGFDGLPPLAEKVAVDPALVNGVDAGLLRGDGETPFTVTFLGGVAVKDSALAYYVVQEDDSLGEEGLILEAGILFGSTEDAAPGAAVQVGVLEEGQTLGLFLVADGAGLNGDRLAGNARLDFVDRQGNTATVGDSVPDLFLSEPGDSGPVLGQVLHASDFVAADQGNLLNPGGVVRTLSGQGEDGSLLVAWEDQTSGSDEDFNDAIVRVEGPGLGPASLAVAEAAHPEGQFGVDVWM